MSIRSKGCRGFTRDASIRRRDAKRTSSVIGGKVGDAVCGGDMSLGGRGDVIAGIGRPHEIVSQAPRRS